MITVYLYEKTGENAEKNTGDFITMSLDAHFGKGTEEKVAKTPLGKPYLENGRAFIGVTHTKDLVVIGISDENFGIDAESLSGSPKNLERIARRFFSEGEKAYFYGSVKGSVERKRRFLEVWVKKRRTSNGSARVLRICQRRTPRKVRVFSEKSTFRDTRCTFFRKSRPKRRSSENGRKFEKFSKIIQKFLHFFGR